jgi:PiT family inorganic phosphate transporter
MEITDVLETTANLDTLIYLAIGAGILMAFGIGANDFSNSMGPAVGGKVLGLTAALVIAIIFESVGATFHSTNVTETIRTSIIDIGQLGDQSATILYGMVSALLAAALWLMIASAMGWPVSTTHSIIGALVGFGIVGIGFDAVRWGDVSTIASSWIVSPLLGGAAAYLLMKSILVLILQSPTPVKSAKRWGPVYVILAGFVVSLALLFKGMTFFTSELMDPQDALVIALLAGTLMSVMGLFSFLSLDVDEVEHVFYPMILFTVCAMAFAHGANDVANAVGPMAIALDVLGAAGQGLTEVMTLTQMYLIGTVGIILGMALFGYKVLHTVGTRITSLSPPQVFCASLATAGTVATASTLGLPVSTTHILIGAVLGVGLAESPQRVNWLMLRTILIAWLITIPVVGVLSALIFWLLPAFIATP